MGPRLGFSDSEVVTVSCTSPIAFEEPLKKWSLQWTNIISRPLSAQSRGQVPVWCTNKRCCLRIICTNCCDTDVLSYFSLDQEVNTCRDTTYVWLKWPKTCVDLVNLGHVVLFDVNLQYLNTPSTSYSFWGVHTYTPNPSGEQMLGLLMFFCVFIHRN